MGNPRQYQVNYFLIQGGFEWCQQSLVLKYSPFVLLGWWIQIGCDFQGGTLQKTRVLPPNQPLSGLVWPLLMVTKEKMEHRHRDATPQ